MLGYVGLGLAALGTVLAFFPATFAVALAVLFAAFVVSLIGIFKKNASQVALNRGHDPSACLGCGGLH